MENAELIKNFRANADFATKQHDNFTLWSLGKQLNDAADALEAADKRVKELEAAQRWIPVGDRLPRSNKPVQVYMPKLYMSVQTGFYDRYYGEDDDEWYEHWVAPSEVTHWQPLPQPPQKGE